MSRSYITGDALQRISMLTLASVTEFHPDEEWRDPTAPVADSLGRAR
jgi:hypothetical protein